MIVVLCIISLLSVALGCYQEFIPPCSCRSFNSLTLEITCKDATDIEQLQVSLHKFQNSPIRTLYIINSSLQYLPSTIFSSFNIERLHFVNCTFNALTDSDVAFVGLEKSLKNLTVEESTIYSGWNWKHLKKLTGLMEIRTVKAGLDEIDWDIADISLLNLLSLQLMQDSISYIDDWAFARFKALKVFSLKNNLIPEVKRSMFPDPATNLIQINLSQNKIEELPLDIFTNMPNLVSILLAENSIVTIDMKTFAPVWSQLYKIDLLDNPLRCDCRLKWLMDRKFPENTRAECREPLKLNGTRIIKLHPDDLWC
ncbi:toll-7 [Trichonephila clavata]|uniref:Toll-7 n=1 Tax=Trichonephila clavata TaxID=2740835 RepID=A0A8X6F528_TRICU|nr:toll-7 [Trichonephila clavata]